MIFTLAGEGPVDVAAAARLVEYTGHEVGRTYPTGGKGKLDPNLAGYNNAAKFSPWLVLRDLDQDASCAPTLRQQLLPNPSRLMLFRIPVRAVEAWLLSDASGFATFFRVRELAVPATPDALEDPKSALLEVVASSNDVSLRKLMLPAYASRKVGTGYSAKLIEFIDTQWEIARARSASPSLDRCVAALRELSE